MRGESFSQRASLVAASIVFLGALYLLSSLAIKPPPILRVAGAGYVPSASPWVP